MPEKIKEKLIFKIDYEIIMKATLVKPTKRNKCDYCDDLAVFKIKKEGEPSLYLCKSCYNENKNKK